jgi:hypothetical protein
VQYAKGPLTFDVLYAPPRFAARGDALLYAVKPVKELAIFRVLIIWEALHYVMS